ncbi:MAG: cation-translocating P-type ATPase [Chitinophagales bacterium]
MREQPIPAAPWHTLVEEQVSAELASSVTTGLTSDEAVKRAAEYGPNELPEAPPRSLWSRVLDQFRDVLVLILLAAAVISCLLGEVADAVVILLVVGLNATLGLVQEAKAEKSLAALKRLSQPSATVVRDGHVCTLPAAALVPGDLVVLEAGNFVPADLRLVEAVNLRVDEAALTGESLPVEKQTAPVADPRAPLGDRVNLAFRGTAVAYGRGRGVVVGTGRHTELGRIAGLLAAQEIEATPLQKRLAGLGQTLALAALALVTAVFLAGLWRGEQPLEMFMTAVSLAVAVVPEGLPAVVTIVLALGVRRMSRQRAIVRRLPAVETLGSATVICSDKTGTLTQNQMTVVRACAGGVEVEVTGTGYDPQRGFRWGDPTSPAGAAPPELDLLIEGLALCSDAGLERHGDTWSAVGDPTEVALVALAEKAGRPKARLASDFPRLSELPFDSGRKRMTTVHRLPGGASAPAAVQSLLPHLAGRYIAFTKGGFDVLLPLCTRYREDGRNLPLDEARRAALQELNDQLAREALRVLALAYRTYEEQPAEGELERDLTFIGLVGMIDPPRPEAAEAVREAQAAGIRTIMITGDHKATATAIAEQLGIKRPGDLALSGAELEEMSDAELAEAAERTAVFARVSPEHKLRIVEALRAKGHVVAMTGDGVNDAPALKRADLGAAMGITGTDVAKEAADLVITDDNFATVVSAVREGRTIYANILKAIRYLLSCNTGELAVILVAILAGLGRPLTALQILWTNLVTDSLPALALGMEPPEPGVMNRPPRPAEEGVFAQGLGWLILLEGVVIGALSLAGFVLTERATGSHETAGTVAFLTLSLSQLVQAFNTRTRHASIFRLGFFSNRPLVLGTLVSAGLLFLVALVPPLMRIFDVSPLTTGQWTLVAVLSLLPLVLGELRKLVWRPGR